MVEAQAKAKEKKGAEATKYHPDLCSITALHARSRLPPEKFLDPDGQHAFDPWQMSSVDELKCLAYIKDHANRWLRHNRCQLSRVYPKKTRVDSSNMLPHPMWDVGCALVALNYHMTTAGQPPFGGHHSPVAAYHAENRRFLVLDCWPQTEPAWLEADALVAAAALHDPESSQPLGLLLLLKPER